MSEATMKPAVAEGLRAAERAEARVEKREWSDPERIAFAFFVFIVVDLVVTGFFALMLGLRMQ